MSKPIVRNPFAILSSVLATVVLVGSAYAAWDVIRPYPTIEEHEEVAGRSCENYLNWLSSEIRAINRDIRQAKKEGNVNWLQTLREDLREVEEEQKQAKRSCGFA